MPKRAQFPFSVSNKVLSSLALIVSPVGNGYTSQGTAFCFWSAATKSYFLTNRHVVAGSSAPLLKLEFFRNSSDYRGKFFKGRVYPQANFAPDDLAVVVIDVGNIPSLPLQWYPEPDAGQPIGIAGFPSFRIEQAATLASVSPSAHFGRVNSRAYTADLIEFDALADHGNSGGPLFDEQNGVVFGVVTLGIQSKTSKTVQNNLAIKSSNVYMFLDSCYLPYVTFSPQYGHKRVVPCLDFPESYAAKASWCKEPDSVVRP